MGSKTMSMKSKKGKKSKERLSSSELELSKINTQQPDKSSTRKLDDILSASPTKLSKASL